MTNQNEKIAKEEVENRPNIETEISVLATASLQKEIDEDLSQEDLTDEETALANLIKKE